MTNATVTPNPGTPNPAATDPASTDRAATDPAAQVAVIDAYIAMWNEADPARRAALIEQCWVAEARYQDPLLEAEGHAGLSAMVDGVHAQFPGQRFERTSGVDVHHDTLRFAWLLGVPGGAVTVSGLDVAEVADDGRLVRITGFFGELPAA